mmetsp:Transcript_23955/g.55301  ORF Transcript_23955/g.55301 Transcript_23955/m.55301 type:complete len:200 (-) Transcript_23955:469-1068(-)
MMAIGMCLSHHLPEGLFYLIHCLWIAKSKELSCSSLSGCAANAAAAHGLLALRICVRRIVCFAHVLLFLLCVCCLRKVETYSLHSSPFLPRQLLTEFCGLTCDSDCIELALGWPMKLQPCCTREFHPLFAKRSAMQQGFPPRFGDVLAYVCSPAVAAGGEKVHVSTFTVLAGLCTMDRCVKLCSFRIRCWSCLGPMRRS